MGRDKSGVVRETTKEKRQKAKDAARNDESPSPNKGKGGKKDKNKENKPLVSPTDSDNKDA
ncbi:hypothetical protein M231_07974 [Tremella mesenterica]|uniref:Uncharacterized protein n=1 Tax=Tremella mesenterica TaxID=5217 RepID=A0A4Q1B7V7_TREME|nr:hypothetical protein M231_07974 [Tremella mesenterica]